MSRKRFSAASTWRSSAQVIGLKLIDAARYHAIGCQSLAFLIIGFVLCFPLPNILPKWAIIAPVFVPLFLKLGVAPEAVLAAYRVSDLPPNVINPLLPHFALVVGFDQRWQKDALVWERS